MKTDDEMVRLAVECSARGLKTNKEIEQFLQSCGSSVEELKRYHSTLDLSWKQDIGPVSKIHDSTLITFSKPQTIRI